VTGFWPRLKNWFASHVSEPGETSELALRKFMSAAVSLVVVPVYVIYGVFHAATGSMLAAQLSFGGAIGLAYICLHFFRTRSFQLASRWSMALTMLALPAIHFALGGFTSSGFVLIYAFVPLLIVPAIENARNTKYWTFAAVGVALLVVIGERFVTPGNPMSPTALTVFTMFNLLGFCGLVLLPNLIHGLRSRALNQEIAAAREAQLALQAEHLVQTQAALEQQTASAEVLTVIGQSVSDAAPVFERIIDSARRLLNTNYVNIGLIGDDGLVHLNVNEAPQFPDDPMYPKVVEYLHRYFPAPVRETLHGYSAHNRVVLHFPDVLHGEGVPPEVRQATAWMGKHSQLNVPLVWKGKGIGAFAVARIPMQPFSGKEITLIKTFADQAVIAIQNARLFKETQQSLDRQTASAEVLRVVSSSLAEPQPVFDAICSSMLRLLPGADLASERLATTA